MTVKFVMNDLTIEEKKTLHNRHDTQRRKFTINKYLSQLLCDILHHTQSKTPGIYSFTAISSASNCEVQALNRRIIFESH